MENGSPSRHGGVTGIREKYLKLDEEYNRRYNVEQQREFIKRRNGHNQTWNQNGIFFCDGIGVLPVLSDYKKEVY